MTILSYLILILLFFRYKSCGIPAKVNHLHYLVTTKGHTCDLTLHCEEKPTNFRKPTAEEGVWFKEMGKVLNIIYDQFIVTFIG